MRITVQVKSGAKANLVREVSDGYYLVITTAEARQGKANLAVIKLLAKHFKTSPSAVKLIFGKTAREKIFEISS